MAELAEEITASLLFMDKRWTCACAMHVCA